MADIAKQHIRSNLGLSRKIAQTGDWSGVIDVPGQPGFCWVRPFVAGGNLGKPIAVQWRQGVRRQFNDTVAIRERKGNWIVEDIDFDGQAAGGSNPAPQPQPQPQTEQWVSQRRISTLVVHPTAPPTSSVAVRGFMLLRNRTIQKVEFSVDLSAEFPSAGEYLYAGLFLKPDLTIEVSSSTAKDKNDFLTIAADLQETITGASAGSLPIWAVIVDGDETTIRGQDIDLGVDLRQFINTPGYVDVWTDDISNPPTDAELDSIYGTPAAVGAGFTAYIDDNGAGTAFYQVASDGNNWWYTTFTKAT